MSKGQDGSELYEGYETWKGWQADFSYDDAEASIFAAELRGVRLTGATVLELGFGSGHPLAWLRDQWAEVIGTEINERLLEAGRQAGFTVHGADLADLVARYEGRLDWVVAFDIFEHFEISELTDVLSTAKRLLKPDGRIIARFPNGLSPFGRFYQYGDVRHKSVLSIPILQQLAARTGYVVERAGNSYRERSGPLPKRMLQGVRDGARALLLRAMTALFTMGGHYMDSNVTVVLKPDR